VSVWGEFELDLKKQFESIRLHSKVINVLHLYVLLPTQVHGLLRGVGGDAPKHDTGQHGAKQQGKAAGHSLHSCESAAGRPTNDREPDVAVPEILGCLHEEQVT